MTRPSLQNRVDPFGALKAVPYRGSLMGNRGKLHDDDQRIRRQSARKAWVTCVLSYKGIKRPVFAPGSYSELFFLDEATAFAAGHRPCKTCQRDRHIEFKSSWLQANKRAAADIFTPVTEIDATLHAERIAGDSAKRTFTSTLSDLPDGTMFEHEGAAFLLWNKRFLKWGFGGYSHGNTIPASARVQVLTPPSIVRMFAEGYQPTVHESACAQTGTYNDNQKI